MEQFDFKLNEPGLTREEIHDTMDFEALVNMPTIMVKSWYQTWWFWTGFGVVSLAIISLVAIRFLDKPVAGNDKIIALSKKSPKPSVDKYWEAKVKSSTVTLDASSIQIDNGWVLNSENETGESLEVFFSKDISKISEFTDNKLTSGALLKINTNSEEPVDLHLTKEISNNEEYHMHTYNEVNDSWTQSDEMLKVINIEKQVKKTRATKTIGIKKFTQNRVNFQFEFDKADFPELAPYENIIFQADLKHEGVETVRWDAIDPIKLNNGAYQLVLQKFDSVLTIDVVPVLSAEDYDNQVSNIEQNQNETIVKKTTSIDAVVKTHQWTVISKEQKIVN